MGTAPATTLAYCLLPWRNHPVQWSCTSWTGGRGVLSQELLTSTTPGRHLLLPNQQLSWRGALWRRGARARHVMGGVAPQRRLPGGGTADEGASAGATSRALRALGGRGAATSVPFPTGVGAARTTCDPSAGRAPVSLRLPPARTGVLAPPPATGACQGSDVGDGADTVDRRALECAVLAVANNVWWLWRHWPTVDRGGG